MSITAKTRLLSKFTVLILLSFFLWSFSRGAATPAVFQQHLIEIAVRQLPETEGRIPVELRCGQAVLSAPNIIENFNCTLRNNSAQSMRAANVVYTIHYEQDGTPKSTSYDSTIDTRIHPDFENSTKLIGPGEESSNVGPPGPVASESSTQITGVEIAIDFLEFEDNSVLGPDREGSRIINSMREGAKKYRNWLKAAYERNRRSVDSLVGLLDAEDIPSDIRAKDSYEELGAKSYRSRMRKTQRTKGKANIEKILSKDIG